MPITFDSDSITPEYLERFYRDASGAPWLESGERYAADPGNKFRSALILEELERLKPKRVLDVGCGGLYVGERAVRRLGCEYAACDLAVPNQIPDGVSFFVSDAAHLPSPDDFYDAVVCSEVLEHLLMPGAAVSEITRVTKPNGCVLITVPNLFSLDALDGATGIVSNALRLVAAVGAGRKFMRGANVHLTRQSPGAWKSLLQSNGLSVEFDRPVFLFPYIPYFLKSIKRFEYHIFSNDERFAVWRRAEERMNRIFPMNRLGQFHFFRCFPA